MESTVTFLNEHLLAGQIGRISVFLAFSFSLVSFFSYFIATIKENKGIADDSWRKLARAAYIVHGAAVIGILISLFYIISHHYFEYKYAWEYSSKDLATQYLFSSFWSGQEGSFLLWTFWHVVLGIILMFTSKKWESAVLTIFAITQVFLTSMLLGVYFFGAKIGSSPFILLRDAMQAPIFSRANYLDFVKDGNGLNPLLQNYWMVIHPPTLFMGFATTIIPFAFVMASLWNRDYKGWVKPVLPWVLYSAMILGIGILMGGAWAYEALSFGGFWAWDPVENASLVPWLTLIAGLHVLVAYRNSGYGLAATYILFITTFLLILYSTFLTRSGILGNTSVHSFVDLGLSGQLLIFMMVYVVIAIIALVIRWKEIPAPKKEEQFSSREFWMFVGALVFTISAVQIITFTSIPIYNKFRSALHDVKFLAEYISNQQIALQHPIPTYNGFQVYVALLIGLLSAFVQYLRYKDSNWVKFFKSLALSIVISAVITAVAAYGLDITPVPYVLMLFASFFAVVANFSYIFTALKGRLLISGASVAHVGFGLMLLGILIANYKQQAISLNTRGDIPFGEGFDDKAKRENIMLKLNEEDTMGGYHVNYSGDSINGQKVLYAVNYVKLGKGAKDTLEKFTLYPDILVDPKRNQSPNPDTRHYLTKDIYTHVSYASPAPNTKWEPERDSFAQEIHALGDTFYIAKGFVILDKPDTKPYIPDSVKQPGDIPVGLNLIVKTLDGRTFYAQPSLLIREKSILYVPYTVKELGVKFRLENINPDQGKFTIGVSQQHLDDHFIIMRAIIFPYINCLWLGALIMVAGFIISIVRRRSEGLKHGSKAL